MSALIGKLKTVTKALLLDQRQWVLGRIACMGQDVYGLLNTELPLWNIQKGRVDYLMQVAENPSLRIRPEQVVKYLQRNDIGPLLMEQWATQWLHFRPPALVYMDSYSELTDQMFVQRNTDWRFCCNYLDLDHERFPLSEFRGTGLLSEEDLEEAYARFFGFIRSRYGPVPILFLHFPTKLEQRSKFKLRHKLIVEVIEGLAEQYKPLYSIDLDPSIVRAPEDEVEGLEDFPYHYNQQTYEELARQVRELNVLPA